MSRRQLKRFSFVSLGLEPSHLKRVFRSLIAFRNLIDDAKGRTQKRLLIKRECEFASTQTVRKIFFTYERSNQDRRRKYASANPAKNAMMTPITSAIRRVRTVPLSSRASASALSARASSSAISA